MWGRGQERNWVPVYGGRREKGKNGLIHAYLAFTSPSNAIDIQSESSNLFSIVCVYAFINISMIFASNWPIWMVSESHDMFPSFILFRFYFSTTRVGKCKNSDQIKLLWPPHTSRFFVDWQKIFTCWLVCGEFRQVCDKIGACRAISDGARSQNVLSGLVG